jgi:hypothetical protein
MSGRSGPWTDLIGALGEERFAQIRDALAAAGTSDLDRDAFLLNGSVGALLREMMPEQAPAEAVNAYGALLHMMHAAWSRGWPVRSLSAGELRRIVESNPAPAPPASEPAVCYVQLPERAVWAEPEPGASHEPLDGAFVVAAGGQARILAVLGLRASRAGFTTIEAATILPAPAPPARADGSPPYAPTLPGGVEAELVSLATGAELAALAVAAMNTGAA